jgi:hypothetical protein
VCRRGRGGMVKLANRIEALKMQEDEEEDVPQEADVPANSQKAAHESAQARRHAGGLKPPEHDPQGKQSLSMWTKQEKPHVRDVMAREAQKKSNNEHMERPATPAELIQHLLDNVCKKPYPPASCWRRLFDIHRRLRRTLGTGTGEWKKNTPCCQWRTGSAAHTAFG